ncbi:Guanine nucleotide-binding protein G(o) subunit alpha-like protein, partial [Dinothrombium tinctorium]
MASFLCRSLKQNASEKDLKIELKKPLSPDLDAFYCISNHKTRLKSRSSKKRSLEIDRQLNELAKQEKNPTVRDNLLSSMKYVLMGMSILKIRLQDPKNKKYVEMVLAFDRCYDDEYFVFDSKIGFALHNLWSDKGVRLAVAKGYQYELNDSAL